MEIYEILLAILDKPDVPKFYRKLRDHYQNNGRSNEVSALNYLIEKKFEKKDAAPSNNSDAGQE
jgi:hypothetical protein